MSKGRFICALSVYCLVACVTFLGYSVSAILPSKTVVELRKSALTPFVYLPGHDCTPLPRKQNHHVDFSPQETPEYCNLAKPKLWTEDEVRITEGKLLTLVKAKGEGRLSHFFATIERAGYHKLRRYTQSVSGTKEHLFAKPTVQAEVFHSDLAINIYDSFFKIKGSELFFHELAHAFDNASGEISESEEFKKLTGIVIKDDQVTTAGMPVEAILKLLDEARKAQAEGDLIKFRLKVIETNQIAHEHGFPNMYSMIPPYETFAELATHIYFETNDSQYIKPEIKAWFQKHVLN